MRVDAVCFVAMVLFTPLQNPLRCCNNFTRFITFIPFSIAMPFQHFITSHFVLPVLWIWMYTLLVVWHAYDSLVGKIVTMCNTKFTFYCLDYMQHCINCGKSQTKCDDSLFTTLQQWRGTEPKAFTQSTY